MEDLVMKTIEKRNGTLFPTIPVLFDDFFTKDFFNRSGSNHLNNTFTNPAINIKDSDKCFELEVAVPGLCKEDFNVEVNDNVLMISAQRTFQIENNEENYTRREFNFQQFQRSFRLPELTVDEDRIEAKYTNGILHVILPKKEQALFNNRKKIKIS